YGNTLESHEMGRIETVQIGTIYHTRRPRLQVEMIIIPGIDWSIFPGSPTKTIAPRALSKIHLLYKLPPLHVLQTPAGEPISPTNHITLSRQWLIYQAVKPSSLNFTMHPNTT